MPFPCITGLEMSRIEGMWLRLDRNGHLDLWVDLTRDINRIDTAGAPFSLLASSAVRDYVKSLCILGKRLYERCGIQEPLIAKLDIWSIKGVSVRGTRGAPGFPGDPHTWSSEHLNLDPIEIDSLNDPKSASQIILQRLGEAFGFDKSPFL